MNSIVSADALGVISELVDGQEPAAADAPSRPSWQTVPCPPWCESVHDEGDYYSDRYHLAPEPERIGLSLYDDDRAGHGCTLGVLRVEVGQHYRQSEPTLSLWMPAHDLSERRVTGEMNLDLTVSEAAALRDQISLALDLVDAAAHSTGRGPDPAEQCRPWCTRHDEAGECCFTTPLVIDQGSVLPGFSTRVRVQVAACAEGETVHVDADGADALTLDPGSAARLGAALLAAAATAVQR